MSMRYMAFLEVLFTEAVSSLEGYTTDTRESVASRWYECMKEGMTIRTVGENRSQFYKRVIDKAKKLESTGDYIDREKGLCEAAKAFIKRLEQLYNEIPLEKHTIPRYRLLR